MERLPPDHKNENGDLFWSGTKKLPKIILFDPNDSLHAEFVLNAAKLFAEVLNVDFTKDFDLTDIHSQKSKTSNTFDDETLVKQMTHRLLSKHPS